MPYEIRLYEGTPAPDAVVQMIACQCSHECKLNSFSCFDSVTKCIPLCKLPNCGNLTADDAKHEDSRH